MARPPGSIEFKRDDIDGRWKLLELNSRLWQQNGFAAACGVDFVLIQYRELTRQLPPPHTYRLGLRWLDELYDVRSAWTHFRAGRLRCREWIGSNLRVRDFSLFAADDPKPLAVAILRVGARAAGRMLPWGRGTHAWASVRRAVVMGRKGVRRLRRVLDQGSLKPGPDAS